MGLKEYHSKRIFTSTKEPKGKVSRAKKLRFVVQKHAASRLHYDFRIEVEGVLKSWAVPKGPSMNPLDQRLAIQVEDHPVEYGSFEGVIPKGNYGAGSVMLWDKGTYEERFSKTPKEAEERLRSGILNGKITFVLHGKKLQGEFALIRLKRAREKNAWLLIKKRDEFARYRPDSKIEDRSVKTSRTMEEIAGKSRLVWTKTGAKVSRAAKFEKAPTRPRPTLSKNLMSAREKPPLTNLTKIYFPKDGYTKGDVIAYYDSIADTILPHLKDRPESLNRHPNGISKPGFYQKDMVGFVPKRVQTIRIHSASAGRTINYSLCQDKWTLLYLANLGCIELNPWLSRTPNLDRPDYALIDLDPDDSNPFRQVVKVALEVNKLLKSVGVKAWCKTSGATGIHICVPTGGLYEYEPIKVFAQTVCNIIHLRFPKFTSVERTPGRRRGKIYLDFLQNRRGQTMAAPYCLRPKPGAPASAPLKWSEVKPTLKPQAFNIKTMKNRIQRVGDLWPQPHASKINLSVVQRKLAKILEDSKKRSI